MEPFAMEPIAGEPSSDWSEPRTFVARFERGPRDATAASVVGLDFGQPPDLLLMPGRLDGIYVLAGGARPDGSLPYWWMSRARLAALRALDSRRPADRIANSS
jgi:hypothetical protein